MRSVVLRALAPLVSVLALTLTPAAAGAASQISPISPAGTSYGYSSVDPAGNLWFDDYYTGTVTRVAPSGTSTTFAVPSSWALTTDASGNAFVVDWNDDRLYEITASGTVSLLSSGSQWGSIYGIVVDPAGGFYVARQNDVEHVTISGTVTVLSSFGGFGLKADAAGNLYTSDLGSLDTIYRISPSGTATIIATSSLLSYVYDLAVAPDGTLYALNLNGDVVAVSPGGTASILVPASDFPAAATGDAGSIAIGANGEIYVGQWGDQSEYVLSSGAALHVQLTRSATSLSASWSGGSGPYVCTLMYGFHSPSTFAIHTTNTSCTFYNLDGATPYGVRVTTLGGMGASTTAMSPAVSTTVTCTRNGHVRHVSGVNPRCPAGWRRR